MLTIIDVHAHIYPKAIAQKATLAIGAFYSAPMRMDGTVEGLLAAGKQAGISKSVVHSVAVTPANVPHINDFIIQTVREHPEETIGFGAMHPDYEDIDRELDRVIAAGLKGIKLHSDFQRFYLDEDRSLAMFEKIAAKGLPVLVHMGDKTRPYSEPERMARVLDQIPNLKAICAHLGGYSCWDRGVKVLAGRSNVWVDTSSSLFELTPDEATRIIRAYGIGHVFFGTDYPMWQAQEEVEKLRRLSLTEEELEAIFHRNLEAFLGIEA